MVSPQFFYQRALWAIIWLFVLWHLTGSKPGLPTPPVAAKPKRKHATEPKAFPGRPPKPHWVWCDQEAGETPPAPPRRPDPRPLTPRRPRTVDPALPFCPHLACDYRGGPGRNNLRAQGPPSGGPWQQFHWLGCNGFFPEHPGTILHGKQAAVALIVRVRACLAEGWGIRATARVFAGKAKPGLPWLVEAAEQRRALSRYGLCALHIEQLQLAAWYAGLRALKAGAIGEDEAIQRLEHSPSWVWTAMAPESQLLLVIEVGPRTLEMAQRIVQQVAQGVAPGGVPRCVPAGLKEYAPAILAHFGPWMQPERRQATGPLPQPRWMPRPAWLYAQLGQSYRRRRLVGGKDRVVFGPRLAIEQVLARRGWTMNTAVVERLNLDLRQCVAALGRRGNTRCQGEAGWREQWPLVQAYHNFVLPPARLRQPLPVPKVPHARGSAKMWRPSTPAMAAGLTAHVWSLKALLLYRVPPWPQPHGR